MKRSILVLPAAVVLSAALVHSTAAAAAATATTGSAGSVTSSSAVVSGTVNPGGQSTTYYFQYGATTAYGRRTSEQSVGQDSSDHAVSATLTGLRAGSAYHYRLNARTASGVTVGADMTFTTAPPPPRPPPPHSTTGRALHVGQSGATVTGTVDTGGAKTTYYFEFGVSARYGLRTASRTLLGGNAQPVSVALHGLAAGQLYHYRLVASNSSGTSRGADGTFSTAGIRARRVVPRVTAIATPRRDRRRRFRFTVRGRVIPPRSVNVRRACRGQVTVRFKAGRRTVVLRQVKLSKRCRFRTRIRLKGRQRHHARFRVTVHFLGNQLLKPRTARNQSVFVG